jgi:D-alanyl-D-alanine carboxypeptidase/D-alanyl-D-alanine-endopeptidase (penicillin-binding protein 4)
VTEPVEPPLSRRAAREAASARPARQPKIDPQTGEPAPRTGIAALIARHPRIWIASAAGVAFLVLATSAVALGIRVGTPPTATGPSGETEQVVQRAVPDAPAAATALRTCSVASLTGKTALESFRGSVVDATTGESLLSVQGDKPSRTASVLKVLTAAAALSKLGPDYRLTTSVFEGSTPGTIVLVGGGDATLSRLDSGESVYKGAAKITTLANQVVAAYAVAYPETPITSIVVDATLWNPADNWLESWPTTDLTSGYLSKVTALQVDGDRADPTKKVSPRSADPVGRAGKAFAEAIATASGQPVAAVTSGKVTSTSKLGEVSSQPVSTLVNQMLLTSDGTLAETLARIVAVKMGLDGSSASVGQAIPSAISEFGPDTSTITVIDGSGLSKKNAVSPSFMAGFMALVRGGQDQLNYIYNSLSVAGETGGLESRFVTSDAKGKVVAKTGHIGTAYTLSGVIEAEDGTALAFAFFAIGEGITPAAVPAIDAIVEAVYACGDNLANA